MNRTRRAALAAGLSWLGTPAVVRAQPANAASANELALYAGADRHEKLLDAAKKESGELSVYHA